MLLTRCPHCRTAFRVQADELEIAGGQVRCGRCAQVFDAYSDLQQLVAATGSGPDIALASSDPVIDEPAAEAQTVDSMLTESASAAVEASAEEFPLTFEVVDDVLGDTEDPSAPVQEETPERAELDSATDDATPPDEESSNESLEDATEEAAAEETYTAIEREIDEALYGEIGQRDRGEEPEPEVDKQPAKNMADFEEDPLEFDLPAGEWDEFFAATEAEGGFLAEAARELAESAPPESSPKPDQEESGSDDVADGETVMSVESWLEQQADAGKRTPANESEQATDQEDPTTEAEPEAETEAEATEPSIADPASAAPEAEASPLETESMEHELDAEAEADAIVDSLSDLDGAWEDEDLLGAAEVLADEAGMDPSPALAAPEATPTAETAIAEETDADEGHVLDLEALAATSAGEALSADTQPEAKIEPAGWAMDPFEDDGLEETRSRWWPVAAVGLIVLLVGQLVHAGRHTLVEQPMLGPLIAKTYTALGAESPGRIDLGNYRLERWVATEKETTPPSLAITAAVTNLGPRDQPLPLIRLELKDRWDDPVASRVFTPREYLGEDTPNRALAPGSSVEANFAIVDPGEEAYGFELDVCIGNAGGSLRCATDPR